VDLREIRGKRTAALGLAAPNGGGKAAAAGFWCAEDDMYNFLGEIWGRIGERNEGLKGEIALEHEQFLARGGDNPTRGGGQQGLRRQRRGWWRRR